MILAGAFVVEHPAETFFHLSFWRELSRAVLATSAFIYTNGFRPSLWRAALFFKELAFWAKSLVVKPVSVYGGAIATDVNPAGVLLNEETREEQRAGYPGKSRQCACRKSVRTRV